MNAMKQSTLFVCLMMAVWCAPAAAQTSWPAGLSVDAEKKTITIDCKVAPRKLPNLAEIYPIEVIACWGAPKGEKAHETVVTFEIKPSDVHRALESLGLKPGRPAQDENSAGEGPELAIFIEVPSAIGDPRRVPIERTLVDRKTGRPMPRLRWFFTGSHMLQPSPDKPDKVYGADISGTLITVFPVSNHTVIQSNLTMKDEPLLKMETDKKLLPAEGTPVKLIIEVK